MNGLSIEYYCPVCKCNHSKVIGITTYRVVKGRSLAQIWCDYCNNELLVEAREPVNKYSGALRYNMQVRDYTKDKFTSLIDKLFDSGIYTDKDSEEFIMNDIISKLEAETSVIGVSRHILGIKKYIELKMCSKFNVPNVTDGYSLAYVIDKGNMDIDKKLLVKIEDTEFDHCIFY